MEEGTVKMLLKYILMGLIIVAVLVEGYYLSVLRAKMAGQAEELRNISVQLQFLRQERDHLREELSAAQNAAGDGSHGDTTQGQH